MRNWIYGLIALVLAGCNRQPPPPPPAPPKPAPVIVNGQIFITTKGEQAVKLNAVEVKVYEESNLRRFMEEQRALDKQIKAQIQKEIASLDEKINKLQQDSDAWAVTWTNHQVVALANKQKIDELEEAMKSVGSIRRAQLQAKEDEYTPLFDRAFAGMKESASNLEAIVKEKNETIALKQTNRRVLSKPENEIFWTAPWPQPITSAITDSNGKFQFTRPTERLTLVVRAARQVGKETEDYLWVETITGLTEVQLNGRNMFLLRTTGN